MISEITASLDPRPHSAEHPAGIIGTSKSNHHPTPEAIWRPGLAMTKAGRYCLDPASYTGSPIPCERIFTRAQNGLNQEWDANFLWSNFPYSDPRRSPKTGKIYSYPVMSVWVDKLCDAYYRRRVKEALTLTKSDCRTAWFHALLHTASAHCFIEGGLKFGGNDSSSFFGSMLFYLGDRGYAYQEKAPLIRGLWCCHGWKALYSALG